MKHLHLANSGLRSLVDDDVYKWARKMEWRLHSKGYVKAGRQYLHRMVLGIKDTKISVDHKNGNKQDNRRENLRKATHAQNLWNAGRRSHNKSGFKGVYKCSTTGRYRAEIRANKKRINLGRFATAEAAAQAYDDAAKLYHREFARLNLGCGE